MQRISLLRALGLMALGLAFMPSAASAGGIGSMPLQVNTMPTANYGPTNVNAASNVQTNLNISGNLGSQNNVNVQTNITGSKVIDSSSNISVINTVNGYQVDYGLNGAQSLNVIDNASAAAAGSNGDRQAFASEVEADALYIAQEMQ